MMLVSESRVNILKPSTYGGGAVVYWMSRDQRAHDNWALLYAHDLALKHGAALIVVFCLTPQFLGATFRQYDFMLEGLKQVEKELGKFYIPFRLLIGEPARMIPRYIQDNNVGHMVTDFSPLKIKNTWNIKIAASINIPFHEVDAHNIVPCRIVSAKQEYAAYTIRPKINKLLPVYLEEFPSLLKQSIRTQSQAYANDWEMARKSLKLDKNTDRINWLKSGEKPAVKFLQSFLMNKIRKYAINRNDPAQDSQSHLSPYLHFGQLSAQRVALEVEKSNCPVDSSQAFLEELIIRRELADNYCYYNHNYDSFDGFPDWAKTTLNNHCRDKRPYIYRHNEFEQAQTHDDLWNAAQKEMVLTGKMHGYMRMYWAKKILEWTPSPEEAINIAISLNDKYEMDGRDPNGYAGIAWSIGGVHDRAWPENPVFGKIRYMNYNGCKRKFDIDKYITKIENL